MTGLREDYLKRIHSLNYDGVDFDNFDDSKASSDKSSKAEKEYSITKINAGLNLYAVTLKNPSANLNVKKMVQQMNKYTNEKTDIILATDTVDYIVFKKCRFDEKKNEGVFEFMSADPITRIDNFRMINKYEWKEESGYVSVFYGGSGMLSAGCRIIFDEDLFDRTECSFGYLKSVSKKVPFNGTDFACTIRNHTLDKDIPDEIKQILFNYHKRTFENGVFRFYKYSSLEHNASDFLDANKNENVSYGMIFNPRFLYDTICEAYSADKNSNAEFGLVFSIDDSCLLTLETNMKAGKSE